MALWFGVLPVATFLLQRQMLDCICAPWRVWRRLHAFANRKARPDSAGNGTFLVLDAARAQGYEVVVAAIKERAFPEMRIAWRGFRSLALAGGTIEAHLSFFSAVAVRRAVTAGQVRHKQIFSSIRLQNAGELLLSLTTRTPLRCWVRSRNCWLMKASRWNFIWLLYRFLVKTGASTPRGPTEQERKNVAYGRAIARQLAQHDIGQNCNHRELRLRRGRGKEPIKGLDRARGRDHAFAAWRSVYPESGVETAGRGPPKPQSG